MAALNEKICNTCQRVYARDDDFTTNTSQWRVCTSENLWFNCSCGSTLMVPKGLFNWYSPSMNMRSQVASIFNEIGRLQALPHIPAAIMQLQTLLNDPDTKTEAIVKTIRKDPILSAEVIKVNINLRALRTSSYRPSKQDESLEYAVPYIGHKHLSNMALVAAIKSFQLNSIDFTQEYFWSHSFSIAAISELMTDYFNLEVNRDYAYISGALCNIGKIIAAICYPQLTDQVLSHVNHFKTQCTWQKAEDTFGLTDHTLLGEIGGSFWGFPDFVNEAIRFHHGQYHELEAARNPTLCQVVKVANQLCHWLNLEPHRFNEQQLNKDIAIMSISPANFANFVNYAKEKVESIHKYGHI